jgi:hypothetical protein
MISFLTEQSSDRMMPELYLPPRLGSRQGGRFGNACTLSLLLDSHGQAENKAKMILAQEQGMPIPQES